jgi:hypothetical protein
VAYFRPWIASFHICGFEGEDPILVILVSARALSTNLVGVALGRSGAGSSKMRANKHKVMTAQAPPPKARKVVSKKATCIKINEPAPWMHSALTPPGNTRGGFRIL